MRRAGLAAIPLFLAGCASGRAQVETASIPTATPTPSVAGTATSSAETGSAALFNDSHFHLLNYIQRGGTARDYLDMTAGRVGRVAMFGIPLQQKWDYFLSGDHAPDYYLSSNADLYYYSFVDAVIAQEYLALPEEDRRRVDPMITGFNPADMYASDHIERALLTFPGVFAGIGEFSIHKEFVSSKVSGHAASLRNPALDRLLTTAGEIGLVVIFHNDIDHVRPNEPPHHAAELLDIFARHAETTIIWAHTGLGRFIAPSEGHVAWLDRLLSDPRYDHVALDISWDEVAQVPRPGRRVARGMDRADRAASDAVPVRHRRRGPRRLGRLRRQLHGIRPAVGTARPDGPGTGRAPQLRAHLRRGDPPSPRLGAAPAGRFRWWLSSARVTMHCRSPNSPWQEPRCIRAAIHRA